MKWLRRRLGLPTEETVVGVLTNFNTINGRRHDATQEEIYKLRDRLSVYELALGRIIAKLEPGFIVSEHDPERKRQSDALGEQVIEKIKADHAATQAMNRRL